MYWAYVLCMFLGTAVLLYCVYVMETLQPDGSFNFLKLLIFFFAGILVFAPPADCFSL